MSIHIQLELVCDGKNAAGGNCRCSEQVDGRNKREARRNGKLLGWTVSENEDLCPLHSGFATTFSYLSDGSKHFIWKKGYEYFGGAYQ